MPETDELLSVSSHETKKEKLDEKLVVVAKAQIVNSWNISSRE